MTELKVPFYLREPRLAREPSSSAADRRRRALSRLEGALRKLLLDIPGNKHEARLWLTSIGRLQVDPNRAASKLVELMPLDEAESKRANEKFVRQLMQITCEQQPALVADHVAGDPELLKDFFRDSPARTALFFEHFNMTGKQGTFQHGARALSRYTFAHREEAWQELRWMGKHPQSPVVVATKPHYWCELHVVHTVQNFVRSVDGFWRSEELREAVEGGHIVAVDYEFFARRLADQALDGSPSEQDRVRRLIYYLVSEMKLPWLGLCQKLIPVMRDRELLRLTDRLIWQLADCQQPELAAGELWQAVAGWAAGGLGYAGARYDRVDDLILYNALSWHGRTVLVMVGELRRAEAEEETQGTHTTEMRTGQAREAGAEEQPAVAEHRAADGDGPPPPHPTEEGRGPEQGVGKGGSDSCEGKGKGAGLDSAGESGELLRAVREVVSLDAEEEREHWSLRNERGGARSCGGPPCADLQRWLLLESFLLRLRLHDSAPQMSDLKVVLEANGIEVREVRGEWEAGRGRGRRGDHDGDTDGEADPMAAELSRRAARRKRKAKAKDDRKRKKKRRRQDRKMRRQQERERRGSGSAESSGESGGGGRAAGADADSDGDEGPPSDGEDAGYRRPLSLKTSIDAFQMTWSSVGELREHVVEYVTSRWAQLVITLPS